MPGQPAPTMALEDWLAELIERLPGVSVERPTPDETRALLDLARVAAHASERVAAPLSTFLVGLACASLPPAKRSAAIVRLVGALEGNGEG